MFVQEVSHVLLHTTSLSIGCTQAGNALDPSLLLLFLTHFLC